MPPIIIAVFFLINPLCTSATSTSTDVLLEPDIYTIAIKKHFTPLKTSCPDTVDLEISLLDKEDIKLKLNLADPDDNFERNEIHNKRCNYKSKSPRAEMFSLDLNLDQLNGFFESETGMYSITPQTDVSDNYTVVCLHEKGSVESETFWKFVDDTLLLSKKQEGKHVYEIEVLALVDHAIYRRWYKKYQIAHKKRRQETVINDLKRYYSHLFKTVQYIYSTVKDPAFQVKIFLKDIIIYAEASWVQALSVTSTTAKNVPFFAPRPFLEINSAFNKLKAVHKEKKQKYKQDVTILITGLDIFLDTFDDTGTNGIAKRTTMCTAESLILVEELHNFGTSNTIAHEIAHTLGSAHDFDKECSVGDQGYIMSYTTLPDKLENHYTFSNCSLSQMKNNLEKYWMWSVL